MDQAPEVELDAAWLFDEIYYRSRYPDLTDQALEEGGFASRYEHFRRVGDKERRAPGWFFDPEEYLSHLTEDEAAEAAQEGPAAHFLRRLSEGVEGRTSVYFDPEAYRARYADALGAGPWLGALHHYLTNDSPSIFDPVPEFSEEYYLSRYRDIADAVAKGRIRGAYTHFLRHGKQESRAPRPDINLAWYVEHNPRVRADLAAGRAPDAFTHYLRVGRALGLPTAPLPEELPSAAQGEALFRLRARALAPVMARQVLDFSFEGEPAVTVVMATRDRLALCLACLASLRSGFSGAIELVLLDLASHDETRLIERFVRGMRLLRFDDDVDPVSARNAAAGLARAEAVLLLDDGVELAQGALEAAVRRLRSGPDIGAVGGMIVGADGVLREAGGTVARDGSAQFYMRGASPLSPEANFVRDVSFCSSLFLLVRGGVFQQVGGFDCALANSRDRDADLCLRMLQAGMRTVYDPSVQVYHHPASVQAPPAPASLLRKHFRFLRNHPLPQQNLVFARTTLRQRRVLFIDDTVPVGMLGSGFVRSRALIARMSALGYAVTVFPLDPVRTGTAVIAADLPDDVEVLHDRTITELESFLHERQGFHDALWVARTHNLNRIRPVLEHVLAGVAQPPLLVLDTEAISALRAGLRARMKGESLDQARLLQAEFRNASICQRIVAVNGQEAEILRGIGLPDVTVIGHLLEPRPTPAAFEDRAGMLFLGAIHEPGSPNHESLAWFVESVLPLVEKELGWETRLTVAGYLAPGVNLDQWQSHPRVTLRGAVADPQPLFDAHRLFVAPTRFAAGMPYKLHEAASFGLPAVATALLARQLGWEDGVELLCAEGTGPEGFAGQIARLYRDKELWSRLRDAALRRVALDTARDRFDGAIREVLG